MALTLTDDKKDKPLGSQSLFRGQLIEIISNYPNGCPLAHLSELAGITKVPFIGYCRGYIPVAMSLRHLLRAVIG